MTKTTIHKLVAAFSEVENATLVNELPSGDYAFELKYDGYRILAFKIDGDVRLMSRRGQDWTAEFSDIARAVGMLPSRVLVLDGEVIAPDAHGVPSFQRLQNRERPFCYVIFDTLCVDGVDTRGTAIESRRATLRRVIGDPIPPLALSIALEGKAEELLAAACKAGFEGLVGKRLGSHYRPGRGLDWIKLKCQLRQEFAVVGYIPYTSSQRGIVGSLVLALCERGQFVFAGKVGTGFDLKTRSQLGAMLERRHVDGPTATDVPRFGGLVRWSIPGPVVEVRFSEWTQGGHARHPSYLGLRPDKSPEDCVRETPVVKR
jgi:bifunctional non-homologous end joining protein LigD